MNGNGNVRSFFYDDEDSEDYDDDFSDEEYGEALGRSPYFVTSPQMQTQTPKSRKQPLSPSSSSSSSLQALPMSHQRPISPEPAALSRTIETTGSAPSSLAFQGISDKKQNTPEPTPKQQSTFFRSNSEPATVRPPYSIKTNPRDATPPFSAHSDSWERDAMMNTPSSTSRPPLPPTTISSFAQFPNHNNKQAQAQQVSESVSSDNTNEPRLQPQYTSTTVESNTCNKQEPPTLSSSTEAARYRKTTVWLCVMLSVALILLAGIVGGIIGNTVSTNRHDESSLSSVTTQVPRITPAPTTTAAPSASPKWTPSVSPTLTPSTSPPTFSPTIPPINKALLNLIANNSPNGDTGLLETGTPQNLAFLATLEDAVVSLLNDNNRLLQRYAMRVFYFSTNGPTSWIDTSGWNTLLDECLWYTSAQVPATICGMNDELLTLELTANGVTGTLPAELGMLTTLTRLYIKGVSGSPGLTGDIPESLAALTDMSVVVLNDHQFASPLSETVVAGWQSASLINIIGSELSGTIPLSVVGLTLCTNLLLDNNTLTGTIPTTVTDMSALVAFGVANNQLTGTLPEFSMPTLKSLNLSSNRMTGALPSFAPLSSLSKLALEGNSFTGVVDTCGSLSTTVSCPAVNCTCACTCV